MRGVLIALASLLLVGMTACSGGEVEAPTPQGRSMAETAGAPMPEVEEAQPATTLSVGEVPVVNSLALSPREPTPGAPITAVVDASDPDGDLLRYVFTWKLNGRVVREGGDASITLTDLGKGDELVVEVVATDGRNQSAPMRARARVANRVPVVDDVAFQPEGAPRAGDVVVATPMARDADGDTMGFEYEWMVNGSVRGRDREFDTRGLRRGDRLTVRVTASDGSSESRPFTSREIRLGNTPPRIASLPELQTESGTFKYQFEAIDADGDRNLRFFLEQAPAGMEVDAITGLLTWKPNAGQTGVHPVEIGVLDGSGEGTTFLFEVTVKAEAQAPANAAE